MLIEAQHILIGSKFKSAQYCSHFISAFVLKKFVSVPSFGLVYLLVPSTFLTWSVTQFLYLECEPMFPFCFRVHKILSAFTTYLTIQLTIFHHLVRPLPYFLDFIFQNFLVIGFSHAIFCSQPDKPTSLEVRDIHYIKGTNLGAQLRRSFLGLAEFFCNAIIYIKSPCHTRWQRLNLSYLGDAPASKTWKRSLGPYWHFLTLASSEVSAIFLDLTFVNSHRFLYPLLSYPL